MLCALAGNSILTITDAKLYIPIVTLSTEDNANLWKLLSEGIKKTVYWNAYKLIAEKSYDPNVFIRETIDSSCPLINRLFVFAYEGGANRVTVDSHRRYFLSRLEIKSYNIEFDGRNFYDQPINNQETNDLIKQYDELRKVSAGQDDDYTTGCLLDFAYFKKKITGNCCWFKQTKSFRCRFKSNSTDYFYWQSRWSSSNLLHLWKIKRNNLIIL